LSRPTSNRPLARSTSRQSIAPLAETRPPPSSSTGSAARRPVVWIAECCFQRSAARLHGAPGKGVAARRRAGLDWRERTDHANNRREAVAFTAREILFDGGRLGGSDPDEGGVDENSSRSDAEPVGVETPGGGSAGAHDVPF
jgi:hypothetical protein